MSDIQGTVAPGWEPVRAAFVTNLSETEEVGAGVAVYHRGRNVVDLTGGRFEDTAGSAPYSTDTLQLVFSTTKGITAIAVAICVDRGLIDYDAPVARYWPEFAANGKGDITVGQLLSHQAGLYTIDGSPSLAQVLDWTWITERLAEQAPLWAPGTAHGYHAVTYGWLAGELVRRVDPGHRSLGTFVTDEIVARLGVEFWIGLPEELESRVSPIIPATPPDDPALIALAEQFMGPNTSGGRALSVSGAFSDTGGIDGLVFNSRAVHAAEIPAANGITNAASLARIYAATIGEVDGVRLVQPATVERMRTTVTPAGEADMCLIMPTTFGMGFMTYGMFSPYAGPGSFGHPGAGGSVAFAQPERELSVGYTMNRMAQNLAADARAQRLSEAAAACADAV